MIGAFALTRSTFTIQLVKLAILVISEGFVEFINGVLPRDWCKRRDVGVRYVAVGCAL